MRPGSTVARCAAPRAAAEISISGTCWALGCCLFWRDTIATPTSICAAPSHVRKLAEQSPAADRWKTLLDCIVARIIPRQPRKLLETGQPLFANCGFYVHSRGNPHERVKLFLLTAKLEWFPSPLQGLNSGGVVTQDSASLAYGELLASCSSFAIMCRSTSKYRR
jgi:hypothetical protein